MKLQTLVVGCDGSENAQQALDAAMGVLAPSGVIHVVTAYETPSPAETAAVMTALPEEFRSTYDMLAGPRQALADAEDILGRRGVDHEGHFVDDHAASAILDVAEEVGADLIVVGSRGLGRTTRFLRGSVSARIANHAKTSFMVVHPTGIA